MCICAYMYIYMCVCIYLYIYINIYIFIYKSYFSLRKLGLNYPQRVEFFLQIFNYTFCSINMVGVQLLWWLCGKENACQYRRCSFNPWLGKIPWRRKWQPSLVFLPGKSHGQRSLLGYSPIGLKRVRCKLMTKKQHMTNNAKEGYDKILHLYS